MCQSLVLLHAFCIRRTTYLYTLEPRFKTTPKLRPLHIKTTILESHFIDFFFYLNSILRPPHYKDYFSSDKVVVLMAEFYCTTIDILD